MVRRPLAWRRIRRRISNEKSYANSNDSDGVSIPPKKKQRTKTRRTGGVSYIQRMRRTESNDDVVVVPKAPRRSKSESRLSRSPSRIMPKSRRSLSDDGSCVRRLYSSTDELLPKPYVHTVSDSDMGKEVKDSASEIDSTDASEASDDGDTERDNDEASNDGNEDGDSDDKDEGEEDGIDIANDEEDDVHEPDR